MFSLNPLASVFTPSFKMPIFNNGELSAVRILNSDDYRSEFLHEFNRNDVADEDLWVHQHERFRARSTTPATAAPF